MIASICLLLCTFLDFAYGFVPEDLYTFKDGATYEMLEQECPTCEYLFKMDEVELQVSPKTVGTLKADFAFRFNLFRSMAGKRAYIKIDFREYFEELY